MNCTNCERKLNPKKIVWLELCVEDNKFYFINKNNPMSSEVSQGSFPFGKDCAKKIGKNLTEVT